MSVRDLNGIVSVFVQRNTRSLNGDQLNSALQLDGTSSHVRAVVQSFGSSLFQLHDHPDGTFSVLLQPTVRLSSNSIIARLVSIIDLHLRRFSRWKMRLQNKQM